MVRTATNREAERTIDGTTSLETSLEFTPVDFLRRVAALIPPLLRTWGADLLTCDKCGGKRRVVACVFSSVATAEILAHLGLPAHPLGLAPALSCPKRRSSRPSQLLVPPLTAIPGLSGPRY